jgi:hypothetical protein
MSFIRDEDLKSSLIDFSEGNTFNLFKLVFNSSYESNSLIRDGKFTLNLLKNTKNTQDLTELITIIKDHRPDYSQDYFETNELNLKKFNDFWKGTVPNPCPLLFALIPHVSDSTLSQLIADTYLYGLSDNEVVKNHSQDIVKILFENSYASTVLLLREKNYLFDSTAISLYEKKKFEGYEEETSFETVLFDYSIKDPKLIIPLSKLCYIGTESFSEKWLKYHFEKEKQDNPTIQKFIDEVLPSISEEAQEHAISSMLYKTKDLDFLMASLKKIGVEDIKSYKPKTTPIWANCSSHENKSIYRKLMRNGIGLFDHYPSAHRIFFAELLNGISTYKKTKKEILESQKIDFKFFIQELLEEKEDVKGVKFNNFSLATSTSDSYINEFLNLNISDLEEYSKFFSEDKFSKAKPERKLELLDNILLKTIFAPTYAPEGISWRKEQIEKRKINLNSMIANINGYSPSKSIHLVDAHLNAIAEADPKKCNDYKSFYFEAVSQIFDIYGSSRIESKTDLSKMYLKMIDYIANDSSLNWEKIQENLNSEKLQKEKIDFYEGSKEIFNYLSNVCLRHTIKPTSLPQSKKIKI